MPIATHNEQLVRDFFAGMGPTLEDFKRTYRERMTDDVVWETVGLPPHEGLEACIAYLDDLHSRTGMEYCTIDVLHLACSGDVVLSERVDAMHRADGSQIMAFRLMGAIDVRDGRIARYTDYLDTAPVRQGMPAGPSA
jgi:limonene-1,2-epoxide hydrolase